MSATDASEERLAQRACGRDPLGTAEPVIFREEVVSLLHISETLTAIPLLLLGEEGDDEQEDSG
ncbi:MAG: hypothetical protein ACXVY6_04135 [Gaiellaceae bacterium]